MTDPAEIITALNDQVSDYSDEIHQLRKALRECWEARYDPIDIEDIVRSMGEEGPP